MPELFLFGIYSVPEIAWVGANEAELTAKGIPFETGLARYREIARGQILGDLDGLLKLIFGIDNRKILGVWVLGTQATELVHIGQAVMAFGGTLDYFSPACSTTRRWPSATRSRHSTATSKLRGLNLVPQDQSAATPAG